MDRFVQAWVEGWVVSRGAAPPLDEPWGWTVDMGTGFEHATRHVLGETGEAVTEPTVRKIAGSVTGSGVWLKAFADPAVVGPWLGPGWWIDPEPGFLMTAALADTPPGAAPDGYRIRTWARGGVTRTMIAAPDGSLAARGQIAPTGATAVVDQIETAPAHRRRGLGALVMRTLHHAAAAQGARTGILGATPQGRALYESLGWRVESPLTSAKFTGAART
ncbi:GNAT family N-acetyltransferase [Streptomyces hilarionis]|uniref:GNAT family N-acetyltransferase n=1 Tax=Streptomyces hilarionis TaxID=2839954 RepID=UPI00211A76A0|nr:GNAT family N-acetyltransferase [Streptomyces hilarionis]MCQ9131519.1 GNAT family N-acetyltransferase [Streptomyces hilarionis]